MAEKIIPPIKSVPRADGVKEGSANTVLTTPNPTFGKDWSKGSETGKLFTKK